jgi:hypothetical protein
LKERRERIEGGSVLEKGEKGRGVWAKQPSSTSPPSRYRTEERVDREAGRWRGKGRQRPRPWGQPGGGAKQRGGRGQLIPLLTLVGDGLCREIDGDGRSATETARAVAVGGSGGREEGQCGLG